MGDDNPAFCRVGVDLCQMAGDIIIAQPVEAVAADALVEQARGRAKASFSKLWPW